MTSNRVSFNYPASGLNNVGEYQASGLPYVTSSAVTTTPSHIQFPYVTKFFTIVNPSGGSVRVGFTEAGVQGTNFFSVAPSGSQSLDIRCKSLFVRAEAGSATVQVVAGLTQIPAQRLPVLTGSAVFATGSTDLVFGYDGLG